MSRTEGIISLIAIPFCVLLLAIGLYVGSFFLSLIFGGLLFFFSFLLFDELITESRRQEPQFKLTHEPLKFDNFNESPQSSISPPTYEQPKSGIITPQAVELAEALRERGISNEQEHYDGYKHVDIYIPEANLYLEIDGKYHLTDPEHLFRDLKRDACSHKAGIDTIRIPNFYVESQLDKLADAIDE